MSTPIHTSVDIELKNEFEEFVIDTQRDVEVTFRGQGRREVFIRIVKAGHLTLRTFVEEAGDMHMLFWNDASSPLKIQDTYEVLKDAHLNFAWCECNESKTERNTYVALRQPGAQAEAGSASLVHSEKEYCIQVVNFAPHTHGNITNYAVVLKNGRLVIDAIGKIVKGAHGSQSHQTSRALSFEEGQRSKILPELLIDENDVQASHAMSMGRCDEEQLYYMMSRGLSIQQCTSLISTGYLMPIVNVIEEESLREVLKQEMERKIAGLCSM